MQKDGSDRHRKHREHRDHGGEYPPWKHGGRRQLKHRPYGKFERRRGDDWLDDVDPDDQD